MVILLSDSIRHFLWMGAGRGKNAWVDLLALWGLLWYLRRRIVGQVQIVGDSKAIIEWVNGITNIHSLVLEH